VTPREVFSTSSRTILVSRSVKRTNGLILCFVVVIRRLCLLYYSGLNFNGCKFSLGVCFKSSSSSIIVMVGSSCVRLIFSMLPPAVINFIKTEARYGYGRALKVIKFILYFENTSSRSSCLTFRTLRIKLVDQGA